MDKDEKYNFLKLSDGKLLTNDGHTFQIHKIVLARKSEYFRSMFCENGNDETEFTIPGVSGECLGDILGYIYSGNVCVTEKNVADLLMGSDYLKLKDLYLEVKGNFRSNMTDANCLKILKVANETNDKEIYENCFRFTQTRYEWMMLCSGKGSVADLPFEILEKILSNHSLYVYSERTVWQSIVDWTEKDISHRLNCVPRLLQCLAISEVDKELAADILQHEIIAKNDALLEALNEVKSSNDFANDLEIFSNLLCSQLSDVSEPYYFRIPIYMNIVYHHSNLYITYDENFDLWNKISKVDFEPDFLTVIGHNMYTFKLRNIVLCKNFDFSSMDWEPRKGRRLSFCDPDYSFIVTIGQYIYILGQTRYGSYNVEKYDTETNRWFHVKSLWEIHYGKAVSIKKKIYTVGKLRNFNTTMMFVFDAVSKQWSFLLSPNMNRNMEFALLEYRQKIYLMGGTDEDDDIDKVEVYDPATNLWEELPDIPHSYCIIKAKVLNDQILVYETELSEDNCPKIFQWNVERARWEELDEISQLQDFLMHSSFCTIEDAETIIMLTKWNRNPNHILEKTHLKINC